MKKRNYNSSSREIQASKTKSIILNSAKALFKKEGFDKVTISRIALNARVSTPTVYAVFKSKRGILQALISHALPTDQFISLVDEFMSEDCPKKSLAITAKMCRKIYDAERGFMDILKGASVVSPELKKIEQERERGRYLRQNEAVKKLCNQKALKKGLLLDKARDILWTLTGRDLYRMMVIERAWTSAEYEVWLHGLLVSSLLEKET